MAKKADDLKNLAGDLKDIFSEIGSLVDQLNVKLGNTADIAGKLNDNQAKSKDLTQEIVYNEEYKEGVAKKIAKLSDEERKALLEKLKTGKGFSKELGAQAGLIGKNGALAGAAAASHFKALGAMEKMVKKQVQANALADIQNKLGGLMNRALDEMIVQFSKAEKEVVGMAKGLNLSKTEAMDVRKNFSQIALDSGDIRVNTSRLVKANADLNAQLGTATVFSGELLTTTSKLTETVGLSAEAAGSLAFQAQRSGTSLREVEENVLEISYGLQQSAGTSLNMKDVLEATGKVSGQLRAQLGANPKAIAEAVTKAKLLGAELEDLAKAGESLLDFESSIEKELEAELLTGKQLNLERARAAALAGDQATLADELAKNMGSFSEFSDMNVLQQQKLAEAMGMSADQVSDMLFDQETMGMNAEQLRAVGKGELADRMEMLDLEERRNLAQEKLVGLMGDVAAAFMPIVEMFASVFEFIMGTKAVMVPLVGVMTALAASAAMFAANAAKGAVQSMIKSAAETFGSYAKIPFGLGIPLAVGAVASMYALFRKAPKVKDGFAPSSKGPFTITDNYGGMATTTPGDNVQVGPGRSGGGRAQPIVIKNTFDAFAASNGNGRKGLGGTQEMQASPTFA